MSSNSLNSLNHLILLKLGGSLITDKKKLFTARPEVVQKLGKEIKKSLLVNKELQIVLTHGGGSFPHVPAKKYGTADGFNDDYGKMGACITADAAAEINRLVIKELLKINLPVATIAPSSIFSAEKGKLKKNYFDSIEVLLNKEIIPVLYGDVIWDAEKGCCIFSGEVSLGIVAKYLLKKGYLIKKIIQAGIEDGVYEWDSKKVIRKITPENFNRLKKEIRGSAAVDVTGGMLHKVEEGLKMAKMGIETVIINGNIKNLLYNTLIGKKVKGTVISK